MQRLTSYINQAMALADLRNLARENPVPVQYMMPNGETMIVVVAHLEPNNVTLPFNVCWIVADPQSPDFGHMLRRVSAAESLDYRNTWMRLNTLDDMFSEAQFWDLSNGMLLGEVDVPQVSAATVDVRGLFALNRNYTPDPASPVVVENNDRRMSDARAPANHTHAKLPITMIQGATGVNQYHIKLDSLNDPLPGHIFVVTGQGAQEGEWIGMWRRPVQADLLYDGPMLESLEIRGPANGTLDETLPFAFKADALFSDGSRITNIAAQWTIIGNGQHATIGGSSGNFVSLDVDEDQTVRVEARWTQPESGISKSAVFDVIVVDTTIPVNVLSIVINGMDEIVENSEATYTVTATFDDGTVTGVTPTTFTSSNPGAGQFNQETGVLIVGELSSDQTTTISASYLFNGQTVSTTLTVVARDLTVYPLNATIIGPDSVDEETTTNYTMRVTYTDSTQRDFVEADWTSSNEQAGSINGSGVFVASSLGEDQQTTLNASYTLEGRTVYATKTVQVRDTTVYPRSATIVGSASVREGSTTTYQLRVQFSDDSTAIVNVTNWAISNAAVGTISATTGQLIAAADVASDTAAIVSASYTANGITVSAQLEITVTDETNYPISARIVGNSTMSENTSQTLQFEVTYLDGSKVNETVNNWTSSAPAAAAISAVTGILTAAVNLQADTVTTVSASFTAEGRTVTAELAVTVRDTTNYPVSAVINGVATINEGAQADYTLAVTFADGSTGNRSAVWAITGGGGGGASVNTSGRVTAPVNVDANTQATLNASFTLDGVTVNAPPRTLQIIDTTVYPVSARILGGNSINEGESRTYQLEVTFTDASVSVVTVTNWASSDQAVGTINPSSGSFNALEVTGSKTTTISASYTAAGRTVGDELTITVLDATNYPVSAVIQGPAQVDEGGQATYLLRVTFTDLTVATVAVTDWTSTQTSVGVINPTTGAFVAAANLQSDGTTELRASYTASGVTVDAELEVTVKDKTVYPVSAVVEGVAVVDSLATSNYALRVTFEDQTSRIVEATWTSSNASAGSIDGDGVFTALNNTTGSNISTVLTGTYSLDGREVSATRSIAVRDLTNYPTGVTISGVNTIMSSDANGPASTQFTARVAYTDGTFNDAPEGGVWSVEGATQSDNVGSINNMGVFTANANATGANRNITIKYQYVEHGRTVTGSKSVAFTVIPLPTTLLIQGPTAVASEVTQAYTARVTRSDSSQAVVPATFSIDAAAAVATITEAGSLVTKRLAAATTVTLTATYTANGVTVTDTHEVAIAKAVELVSISVDGVTEVNAGNTAQYTVTASYDNDTTADVTASATYSSSVPAAGTFSSSTRGLFTAANVSADTQTVLSFGYTANGVTRSAQITLEVKAPVVVGSALPRYGTAMFSGTDFKGSPGGINQYGSPAPTWTGIQQFADQVMTNLVPNTDPYRFSVNLGEGEYAYFMHPKSLTPRATFIDHGANMPGGFGGMTWTPEGSVPEDMLDPNSYAPLEVMYDPGDGNGPQPWIIYRTDWDFLGPYEFTVSY